MPSTCASKRERNDRASSITPGRSTQGSAVGARTDANAAANLRNAPTGIPFPSRRLDVYPSEPTSITIRPFAN